MSIVTYLFGRLADHSRGLVLSEIFSSQITMDMPEKGVLFMFGQEWQSWEGDEQDVFLQWAAKPGRLLLLVPPFLDDVDLVKQLDWKVSSLVEKPTVNQKSQSLAALLSDEARFYLNANHCLVDDDLEHRWADHRLNTMYFKHHSSSGVFAATSLPLWSLTCLENTENVFDWLKSLFTHAGEHKSETVQKTNKELILIDAHYVMLCCAYEQSIESIDWLVKRAKTLAIFQLPTKNLYLAASELKEASLIDNNGLTDLGQQQLSGSGFQIYADEISRMKG